jgi:hypothetical protein
MLGVDRPHQPVEKPAPPDAGRETVDLHRRREPHHTRLVAKAGRRADRLRRRGTAGGAWSVAGGSMPVPSVASPSIPRSRSRRPTSGRVRKRDLIIGGAAIRARARQGKCLHQIGLSMAPFAPRQHELHAFGSRPAER